MASGIAGLVRARGEASGPAAAYLEARTGTVLTWSALAATADQWMAATREAGLSPGCPVALVAQQPLAFAGAYLGLLASGAVVLPLDPGAPDGAPAEIAAVTRFACAAVATDASAGHAAATAAGIPAWELLPTGGPGGMVPPSQGSAAAPRPAAWAEPSSVLLRTSGTTGRPKGVPLAEDQLLHGASSVIRHHQLTPAERVFSSLPLFHINAQVTGILAALTAGSSLVVDDRFHRRDIWDVLEAHQVTVLNAVPAILALLSDGPPPPDALVRRVRFARSASAPLPAATLLRFQERCGISVLETYGMTEAAGQICASPLRADERRLGSVGYPVGVELRIVDEAGEPVGPSEPGEIQIRGPSVTNGYILPADPAPPEPPASPTGPRRLSRDPAAWLPTGDVGLQDAEGFVFLLGRTDGVINRGGEKVYPREVEEVLLRHAGVAGAAVVGEPDPILGERPVAFVVPKSPGPPAGGEGLPAELLGLCQRELSRHKQPVRIEVTDSLPATATGKVRHEQLRVRATPARATGVAS